MEHISKHLELPKQELSVTQPGVSPEKKFVEALKGTKVKDATIKELDQLFRGCFTVIGLRASNYPTDQEAAILYKYLIDEYGGHTLDEVALAFKKACKGELDIDEKEVNAYENFSCLYLSRIMNSYRRWALQEYRQVESKIQPVETKLLNTSEIPQSWGAFIENEYQHFLSFGAEKMKLWPAEFYDQLVTDGFIEKDFFRAMMHSVRDKAIGDLVMEKTKIQNGVISGMSKERQQFAESIRNTTLSEIEKKISAYRTGEKDKEIELLAKQASVLKLFQAAREKFKENIYKQD